MDEYTVKISGPGFSVEVSSIKDTTEDLPAVLGEAVGAARDFIPGGYVRMFARALMCVAEGDTGERWHDDYEPFLQAAQTITENSRAQRRGGEDEPSQDN